MTQVFEPTEIVFPRDLVKWYGHHGGVKSAFVGNQTFGCPENLETALSVKLSQWTKVWCAGAECPRILLLVGGPGNGKTTMVEKVIQDLDQCCCLDGALVLESRKQCTAGARKVEVNLRDIAGCPHHLSERSIAFVQEGTSKSGNVRPGAALVTELQQVIRRPLTTYICCVNRGIIVDALVESSRFDGNDEVHRLLEAIMGAVSIRSAKQPKCWPLDGWPSVAVWPMDADTLMAVTQTANSPAKTLFQAAIKLEHWKNCSNCASIDLCPISRNVSDLRDDNKLNNLLQLLRDSETASGKKFSFRDARSMVPALLLGPTGAHSTAEDLCDRIRDHTKNLSSNSNHKKVEAAAFLSRQRTHHILFRSLPSLSPFIKIARDVEREISSKEVQELLRSLNRSHDGNSPPIFSLLGAVVEGWVDPAKYGEQAHEISPQTPQSQLEELASRGVEYLLQHEIFESLWMPERTLLEHISNAEQQIRERNISSRTANSISDARKLTEGLKRLALVLSLRAMAISHGHWGNKTIISEYSQSTARTERLRGVVRMVSSLLNQVTEGRDGFAVSLRTALCQPGIDPKHDVLLLTKPVEVRAIKPDADPEIVGGGIGLPFLNVDAGRSQAGNEKSMSQAPLTYFLFQHLQSLNTGTVAECLPEEVHSLVESMKARIGGNRCRDKDLLVNDVHSKLRVGDRVLLFDQTGFPILENSND